MQQKVLLILACLFSVAPLSGIEHKDAKPYVIDLYTAVKNNTGLKSYVIWYSSQEKEAVRQGEAAGASKASIYWQAAEYAYDIGDPKTAVALKKSFAAQEGLNVPYYAIFWVGIAAGYQLFKYRFRQISAVHEDIRQSKALEERLEGYQIFNRELNDMGQPQLDPIGIPNEADINAAYRTLQMHWHPDRAARWGGPAARALAPAKSVAITHARDILVKGLRPDQPGPDDE